MGGAMIGAGAATVAALPRYDPRLDAFVYPSGAVADRLLGHDPGTFSRGALEAAARGDFKPALREHRRELLLTRDLQAGPGHQDVLRVRIDGEEVEVGHVAGKDRRPWWRRVFT